VAADEFVMTPRPPVRALALAAVLAIAGAVLIVVPVGGVGGIVLTVAGAVLLVCALALGLVAFAVPRRQKVVIRVDDEGYRVEAPGGVRQGEWSAVTRVTASPGRLTLHQGERERVHLVSPAGPTHEMDALGEAISRHLDANRGYRTFEG